MREILASVVGVTPRECFPENQEKIVFLEDFYSTNGTVQGPVGLLGTRPLYPPLL